MEHIEDLPDLDWKNMTQEKLLEYFPCKAEIADQVYDTLLGRLIPSCRLPWVENIFEPGKPCYEAYCQMLAAYERLCSRLGVCEDDDVETIIYSLRKYGRISAMEMFRYGREYQKMQDSRGTEK